MLQFLTAVDLTTKENANEAGFKEHGSELLYKASKALQAASHLRALFVNLIATKAPEFGDLSQKSINSVYDELIQKLSNTRLNEFIDSFKQSTAAHKGMGTLVGQN